MSSAAFREPGMTPSDRDASAAVSSGGTHLLREILGMDVVAADGRRLGHVNDLRLAPTRAVEGTMARLVVDGLVIDGRHAGSMLGYDRRAEQGPRLVRLAVRGMHRHAGYAPWTAVSEIHWTANRITLTVQALEPLDTATRG
jgi:hypothetical protein